MGVSSAVLDYYNHTARQNGASGGDTLANAHCQLI